MTVGYSSSKTGELLTSWHGPVLVREVVIRRAQCWHHEGNRNDSYNSPSINEFRFGFLDGHS